MIVTTAAIVLHSIRYGDADLIAKVYTRQSGLRTYLLRGILKSKKGKIKASLFQPLSLIEVVANHKDKGTMEYLKDAKIRHYYQTLHTEVIKSSVVLFLSEVLKDVIQEEEANVPLFDFIENSFLWADTQNHIGNFHLYFLVQLSKYLGFYPDTSLITKTYFNLLEGVFQEVRTNDFCMEGKVISNFRFLLQGTYDSLQDIKLNKSDRSELLDMILLYYQLHLNSFKKPKSLGVLNEIYR